MSDKVLWFVLGAGAAVAVGYYLKRRSGCACH
jgi:hypothetical protein